MDTSVSPSLETLGVDAQLEKETTLYELSGETLSEIDTFTKKIPIEIDRKVGGNTPVTMGQEGHEMNPPPIPPMPPIDSLVRLRGVPIVVPQNLAAVDIPCHLLKFYGTKNEDPSRHMERHIKKIVIKESERRLTLCWTC